MNKSQNKTSYELFNGTKEAAGQDLKKDMSSLRYIALPNWFHEAHLESTTSTNSTNFLGTKEAAGQDVKKDMSSLRYTALSNWFHEAHLESTTSNAQDACNTDAPESSGNFNPTATSTNPSADHMETLAVETPIPTVSSPVPTDCLNDSPELSKAMQEELLQFKIQNVWSLVNCPKGPPGFQDPEFPAKVYKVEKAMYGLHQAPRAWHRGDFLLVQVYVGDIIFGSSNPQLCREFEALMHEKFQISVMGELNLFLGLQVLQKKDGIFLSQDKYVGDILKKFGYSDDRSSNTPMDKENPWGKPPGFQDPEFPAKVYNVEKAMYGLHQAPRA
nr:hypothetical protein [Tanacetum cinerariifolium]